MLKFLGLIIYLKRMHFKFGTQSIVVGISVHMIERMRCVQGHVTYLHRLSEKKTSTHIIGYKLRNSCLILIIFDTNIPHIIRH